MLGVGALMFGMAVNYVGMSLTNGIAMGLAAAVGSLVPFMQKGNLAADRATLMVLLGNLVMVIGVGIVTWAGIGRDRIQAARGKAIAGIQTGRLFWLGLLFCILSGVASAMLNIGNVAAGPITKEAVRLGGTLTAGAESSIERNASIMPWVVIFWGGAIVNVLYVVFFSDQESELSNLSGSRRREGDVLGAGDRGSLVFRPGLLWPRRGADGQSGQRGRVAHVLSPGLGRQQRVGHSHQRVERRTAAADDDARRKRRAGRFRRPLGLRQQFVAGRTLSGMFFRTQQSVH